MPQSIDESNAFRDYMRARDVASYLLPGSDVNELLLWPPNLFAFTSYILSVTGSYQLAVSPPRGKSWPPSEAEIRDWHSRDALRDWLLEFSGAGEGDGGAAGATRADAEALVEKYLSGFDLDAKMAAWMSKARWPEDENGENPWIPMVQEGGDAWREKLASFEAGVAPTSRDRWALFEEVLARVPVSLLACWAVFSRLAVGTGRDLSKLLCNRDEDDCYDTPAEREEMWQAVGSLLSMHAMTDEACVGWGIRRIYGESLARNFAESLLKSMGTMATIHPDRCRVMPKRHNPNVGITLRSLSCNLAFHRSSVEVVWRESGTNPLTQKIDRDDDEPRRFYMLLLPWPLHVRSECFQPFTKQKPVSMNDASDGFFIYDPGDSLQERDILRPLLRAAQREGEVDMVVLPESAIHFKEVDIFQAALLTSTNPGSENPISALITGVREKPRGATFHRNAVYCKTAEKKERGDGYYFPPGNINDMDQSFKQYKHHRWRLNRSQILQYGLSHKLSTRKNWWEGIKIGRRRVSFINIGRHLTVCPLICEDLARQDPIADLIRAVGPSLVVTILMDGPQKAERWSSRYASVLSEDPGSAVITLTSYGMVRRCNTPFRGQSHVVALWSDGNGPTREIELAGGAGGILLTLDVKPNREQVADGRIERVATSRIELADVIQVYAEDDNRD
ncbi:MAG TPA: hypothetical protein VD968_10815 [Pyrinomonadaceae bacterium]|nr:hypothetical protein [Pyrinomonadaceae bacterium]